MARIGDRIRALRSYLGLNISSFAEVVGLSQPFVSQIEKGARNIGPDTIERLHSTFGVSSDWVKSGEGSRWSNGSPIAFQIIKERGIAGKDELEFLAELLCMTWESNKTATSEWVAKAADATGVLISLLRNRGDLESYLNSTLPPNIGGGPVDDRPALIRTAMEENGDALGWGNYTARCLLVLLRDGLYDDLSPNTINKLSGLLTPWIFWVAKRSFTQKSEAGEPFIIDTKYLEEQRQDEPRDPLAIRKGDLELRGYISTKSSFAMTFPSKVMITFEGEDLLALVHCLSESRASGHTEVRAGHWAFMGGQHPSLQFKFVFIPVSGYYDQLQEMREEISRDGDLMRRLTFDYVMKYGAV